MTQSRLIALIGIIASKKEVDFPRNQPLQENLL